MGWGRNAKIYVPYKPTYAQLEAYLAKGRKKTERVVACATFLRKEGEIINVVHYNTAILKFHKNGRIEINCNWTSPSTIYRVEHFAGVSIRRGKLPTINGRLPLPSNPYVIKELSSSKTFVFNGVTDYITIKPDGTIDEATIKPIKVECVKDTLGLSRLTRAGQKIYTQCRIRHKLGAQPSNLSNHSLLFWITNRLDTPLEEIDYESMPDLPYTYREVKRLSTLGAHIRGASQAKPFLETKFIKTL